MADIFLSYANPDRDRVHPIAKVFVSLGYTVFWDPDIKPGDDWRMVIETELDKARCVVVIWSQQSITSSWVYDEACHADQRKALVPILIDNVVNKIPLGLRRLQAANLVGVKESELPSHPAFLRVLQKLQELLEPVPSRDHESQESSHARDRIPPAQEENHAPSVPATAEPVKVRRTSPRRYIPGFVIAALLLTMGAISLTGSSGNPPRKAKDQQNIPSPPNDTLNSSPPVVEEAAPRCARSCAGCCIGDTCHTGDQASACGSGGMTCIACAGTDTCDGSSSPRACSLDLSTTWRVQPSSATIAPQTSAGFDWDVDGSPPDVVVEVTCPSAGEPIPFQTPEIESFTPQWTEGSCLTTADALLKNDIQLNVIDVEYPSGG